VHGTAVNLQLGAADHRSLTHNTGAAGPVVVTVPALVDIAPGFECSVLVLAEGQDLTLQLGDSCKLVTWGFDTPADGNAVSSARGSLLTIKYIGGVVWAVKELTGEWSYGP
jgi:hypothetical protein